MKEDLKPTQKDIIDANNRVSKQEFEAWRQAIHEYLLAGGKITFEWDKNKRQDGIVREVK
jgi:hypothetical protein